VLTDNDAYDVVIVGAGVAGCAAALNLPPGTRGLLIDRAAAGADRCCGLLAPDVAALGSLALTLPNDVRTGPEPRIVEVHDLDSGRRQSYRRDYMNVDRCRFDSWLLDLATRRVEVRHQTRLLGFTDEGVVLKSGRDVAVVKAAALIGADGAGSRVRRSCFPDQPAPPLMIARQARLPCDHPPATHVVLFASSLTGFYAWAIPKGHDVLVGCGFDSADGSRERFERVLQWYRAELGLDVAPAEVSGRYLSRPSLRAHVFPGNDHVLLVGEAAGLVSPSSGEGISFALLSGAAAGRAVVAGANSSGRAVVSGADARAGASERRRPDAVTPGKRYASTFSPLSRKIMTKTLKARIVYTPATRRWALRLLWCP
jgi:geranylgeranyl diphosphate/geranylgeranyl-bacteriochlorophyllide a reductase